MMFRSDSTDRVMTCRYSRCCPSSSVALRVSAMPSTPFIGVRISWLIVARNWSLALSARRDWASSIFSSDTSRRRRNTPRKKTGSTTMPTKSPMPTFRCVRQYSSHSSSEPKPRLPATMPTLRKCSPKRMPLPMITHRMIG